MSISVVIPAYNAGRYLAETLESVLSQTRPADEVLVIDDGSADDTAAVAAGFAPWVRVFSRPNAKLPATRNFGAQQATGEWIAFLDADDVWMKHKLERQMQEISAHPGADLCYTSVIAFRQQGDDRLFDTVVPVPPANRVRESLYQNTTFLPSTVLLRRSTFLSVGGSDTSVNIGEDWDLWLRLLHAGATFVSCEEPLVQYRIHAGNMSGDALASLDAAKQIYRRHVLPRFEPRSRNFAYRKMQSAHESAAAQVLRSKKDPRCLNMMATSILRFPWNDPHRYMVFAYMLLKGPR